jgi:hypothetical protein
MKGQRVCGKHGGKAPQALAKAAERVVEDEVRKMLPESFESHPDPLGALLRLVSEAEAFKDALRTRVNDLNDRLRYQSQIGTEQLRAEVSVYERSLDRVGRLLIDLARLDLDARMVRVSEREVDLLEQAWSATIRDPELALTSSQRSAAPAVFARHLRLVRGAS